LFAFGGLVGISIMCECESLSCMVRSSAKINGLVWVMAMYTLYVEDVRM